MKDFLNFLIGTGSFVFLVAAFAGIVYGAGEIAIRFELFDDMAHLSTGIWGHVFQGGRLLVYTIAGTFMAVMFSAIVYVFLAGFGETVRDRVRNIVFLSKMNSADERGAVTVTKENE